MVGFLAGVGLLGRILFSKPPDLPTEWRDSPFSDFGVKEVGASEDKEMQPALRYSYRDTSSHRAGSSGLTSRPARMADRRTTGTGSGSAAYQRMAAREEEARAAMNDRIEAQLDRIIDEIGEVKTEVRRIDQKSGGLENRMTDIERQMIDTRDAVQRARAAVPAATVSAGRQVADELKKSWLAKVAAVCISIMAVYTLTQAIPKMVRATDHFLAWVRTADAPQNGKATDKTTST